jgi:hypothetical protein
MKVVRLSDNAELDAIFEDRGCAMPAYDARGESFPAWTGYFECGDACAYIQFDLRVAQAAGSPARANALLRTETEDFIRQLGFEPIGVPNCELADGIL